MIVLTEWLSHDAEKHAEMHDFGLFCVVKGVFPIYVNKSLRVLEEGECILFGRYSDFSVLYPLHEDAKVFHAGIVNGQLLEYFMQARPEGFLVPEYFPADFFITNLEMLASVGGDGGNEAGLASAMEKMLFLALKKEITADAPFLEGEAKYNKITSAAMKYIRQHYKEELTLTDIAGALNFSVYYLSHIFKDETGMPPIQYLTVYRMEKAKELLLNTDSVLSAISDEVGYSNTNYFNMLFKKIVGITPGKYRKKFKNDK